MRHILLTAIAVITLSSPVFARDQLQIAGSSTVLPYATMVAEAFGENFEFLTPVVEGGGSGAGRKKLCEGVGENTIDIANSSSKMKDDEYAACADNGVTDIKEVLFGYDGIVFASDINGPEFKLTTKDIYLALSASSTASTWNEINPALPNQKIIAFIPGTKHGTREVFDVKVLETGCKEVLGVEKLDDAQKETCHAVRTDGAAVDIDGDYTETLARLNAEPKAVGVFGLSFYKNNTDKLQVATVNDVIPSVDTIASGDYPISRPLYFYVKMQHVGAIPGLKEYVQFFLSDGIAGQDGILAEYGLIPDPELSKTQEEWK